VVSKECMYESKECKREQRPYSKPITGRGGRWC
jgi:hypothetical protein